jgi:hypothetical protein
VEDHERDLGNDVGFDVMHFPATCLSIVILFASVVESAAASPDLSQWFFTATAAESSGLSAGRIKPDYLGGTSMRAMDCGASGVRIRGVWELVKYDRKHHIGLAVASTDECSVAIFKASPPGVNVRHADLSQYSTGRGLHIGSTYQEVVATYGGSPAKHGSRFVVRYAAGIPDTTVSLPHKPIADDEILTIVVDNNRVTAITASINLSGEY